MLPAVARGTKKCRDLRGAAIAGDRTSGWPSVVSAPGICEAGRPSVTSRTSIVSTARRSRELAEAASDGFRSSRTSPTKRTPLRGRVLIRRCSVPLSPMALRTALMRVLSADLDTMRPPQIDSISSSRLTFISSSGWVRRNTLVRMRFPLRRNKVKIAQIAPLAESVPPRMYGGTERIVSYLTEELVKLGHEVTLFASGDSITSANLVSCATKAVRLNPAVRDIVPYYMLMLDRVRQQADDFDILHFHIDHFHFPVFRSLAAKTVTTLHGRQDL